MKDQTRSAIVIVTVVLVALFLVFLALVPAPRVGQAEIKERVIDYSKCVSYGVGKACLGMTKAEVATAIGLSTKVNRTVTPSRVDEQWVYGDKYLYFEGDLLVSFQE